MTSPEHFVHVVAHIHPRPEHHAEVEAELRGMVVATRAEPGNLRYDLYTGVGGEGGFHLVETYADPAALEAHRLSPHYQAYRQRTAAWLARPTEVKVLAGLDVAP